VQEANRILSGGQPSAALRRFAREAGITPGELLNRHIDFFPGSIEVPAADRQRLLQMGQQARGLESSARQAASGSQGPVARAGGWVMDVLMGTRPAAAAPSGAAQLRSAVGVASRGDAATAMPRGADGLLSLIRRGEGGWNSVNRGRAGDTPRGIGNLTSRTIGSLEQMQSRNEVFAVGAYQFTPGVLARARREAGLPPDAPFNPENQGRMAMALLTGTKRPALAAYLKGQSNDLNAAHWEIAREWAALQAPNGRGVYDNDSAGNKGGIPAAQVRQLLIETRRALSGR
jgi:hypothetical protein